MPDEFNLGKITSLLGSSGTVQRLSFGGVVGRMALVAAVATLGIAYATGHTTQQGALIGVIAICFVVLVMAAVVLCVIIKKPELATLEGSHVLNYKQLMLGAKDFLPSGELLPVPDPGLPEVPSDGEDKRGDAQ